MSEKKDFYKNIIDNLFDGVYFVDCNRVITYWNKGAERITGYSSREVVGRTCQDNLLNHVNVDGLNLCKNSCPLAASIEDGRPREAEIFLQHADGYRLPVLVRTAPLRNSDGAIIGAVETFSRDQGLRAVRQELQKLRRDVFTDKLTRIPARSFIEGRLHAAVAEVKHMPGRVTGLFFIDIDGFKQVNDRYGHDAGDKVLRMVASNLRHNLRKSDDIGRWGGEEFLAILYDIESKAALVSIAEMLRKLIETSHLNLRAAKLRVTVSIGATILQARDTAESAVKRADQLMYKSKQTGRNKVTAEI